MSKGSLCFSRKPGECFTIFTNNGDIKVCITESSYSKVRINVNAPEEMLILRDELIKGNKENE